MGPALTKLRGAFDVETQTETKQASKLMARMCAAIKKAYPSTYSPAARDHEISVTLARILFLMFGDDTAMWPDDAFRDLVHQETNTDGSDIGEHLNLLFRHLNAPPSKTPPVGISASLPYVNGGIFEEEINLPPLNKEFRDAVLDACAVDWSTISPAIFGSMFQSVRNPQTRRELGEHYTSETNILKTLNPLFLDELRAEFERILTLKIGKHQKLNGLWNRLGAIRYLDPACGCGNFIIVAYRELRDLELRIMDALANLSVGEGAMALAADWTHLLKVTLNHFYGIEIDEWSARIAEAAMFLIDRQCDLRMKERFGVAPERLPIRQQAHIKVGDALEVDWKDLCDPTESVVIAGNPPFLGHISRTALQTQQLRAAWGGADIGRLDYVTAWHATALAYFGEIRARWAFVSTNSVTQGDQVPRLFGPIFNAGWRIRFAHRTFAWTSEASGRAAVHCNILGFDRDVGQSRLFDYPDPWSAPEEIPAGAINGYLVDGPNVLVSPRASPLSDELTVVTFGNMPRDGGHLIVEADAYAAVAADPVAAKYLRRFLGSEELLNGSHRWCLWMVDLDPLDVTRSPVLKKRIAGVREMRLRSSASSTRAMAATPHLFGQRSGGYDTAYLGILRVVSENRPYFTASRLGADVIPSDRLFTAPDEDGFLFGVISSSMFLTWQLTVGNRLESRPSFSNTLVWNNLPLRNIEPETRRQVIARGRAVGAARALQPGLSLAALYELETMSPELVSAHADLDAVIDRIFGLRSGERSFEERQAVLLKAFAVLDARR